MGFYSYERLDNADGSIDYESSIQGWCSSAIQYLGYVQLFTTLLLWMGFLLNKTNIIIKSGWRAKTQENLKHLSSDVKFILKPLEPAFGEIRAKELPIQAVRVLLLTEGPYHPAFYEKGERNFVFWAVEFEYKWICLSLMMQNGEFVFILLYLAFSLQGIFQSPLFYSFHLLDVIVSFYFIIFEVAILGIF